MSVWKFLKEKFDLLKVEIKAFYLKKIAKKKFPYTICHVGDFPENITAHTLYLLGQPDNEWLAGMMCPCGCGDLIELVLKGYRPRWSLSISNDGKPTLSPSINRSIKCKSHFYLKHGEIIWCGR